MEIVKILARFVVSGLAIVATAFVLPGIHIVNHDAATFISLALVVGIVNGVVKPIAKALAFPLSLVTFGLIHLVINALLLLLVAQIIPDLKIDNFGWAILGGLILSVFVTVLEFFTNGFIDVAEKIEQRPSSERVS